MTEQWLSARNAMELVCTIMHVATAPKAICSRAFDRMISARALKLIVDDKECPGDPIPDIFWWAEGGNALNQNWASGDFSTWVNRNVHWKAYGVEFERSGIMALIGQPTPVVAKPKQTPLGGRPPQTWWDDLWCAISAQIHRGELMPNRQTDIEKAMMEWAAANGHDVAESTIRPKARKLFHALEQEDENPPAF